MKKQQKKPPTGALSKNTDSPEDREKLEPDSASIHIPDAIEGQEGMPPMPPGAMADTTAASADEEGAEVFDENIISEEDSNVTETEKETLREAANDMPGDDEALRRAALDSEDNDGTPLNEGSFDENISPDDLDVPGADMDDADEKTGSEDEENNEYSLGGEDNEDAARR